MKFNKQLLLFLGIMFLGISAYTLIPNFERENFNPEIIEDISSGTITTTTLEEINANSIPEVTVPIEIEETFETPIYDSLLINNNSKRIDDLFTAYLIIGSDERSYITSASRGQVEGSRADVIRIIILRFKLF